MSEHTPEPWKVMKDPGFVYEQPIAEIGHDDDGAWWIVQDHTQMHSGGPRGDARRIVVCINACQGLSTEEVEGRNFWTDDTVTTNETYILTQERDESRADAERYKRERDEAVGLLRVDHLVVSVHAGVHNQNRCPVCIFLARIEQGDEEVKP